MFIRSSICLLLLAGGALAQSSAAGKLSPDRVIAALNSQSGHASVAASMPRDARVEYRLLATNRTSTMQREMNQAADAGFRFGGVMGGETEFGGSEVVVVMQKNPAQQRRWARRRRVRLGATRRSAAGERPQRHRCPAPHARRPSWHARSRARRCDQRGELRRLPVAARQRLRLDEGVGAQLHRHGRGLGEASRGPGSRPVRRSARRTIQQPPPARRTPVAGPGAGGQHLLGRPAAGSHVVRPRMALPHRRRLPGRCAAKFTAPGPLDRSQSGPAASATAAVCTRIGRCGPSRP